MRPLHPTEPHAHAWRFCSLRLVGWFDLSMSTRPIHGLRWWIGSLLMASTIINYVDRQTLSVLAPYLKHDYGWNNGDFAKIVISFRLAYAIGQSVCGRLMDHVGTR